MKKNNKNKNNNKNIKRTPFNQVDRSIDVNYDKLKKQASSNREYYLLVIDEFMRKLFPKKVKSVNLTDVSDDVVTLIFILFTTRNMVQSSHKLRSDFYDKLLYDYNELQNKYLRLQNKYLRLQKKLKSSKITINDDPYSICTWVNGYRNKKITEITDNINQYGDVCRTEYIVNELQQLEHMTDLDIINITEKVLSDDILKNINDKIEREIICSIKW